MGIIDRVLDGIIANRRKAAAKWDGKSKETQKRRASFQKKLDDNKAYQDLVKETSKKKPPTIPQKNGP